MAPLSDDKHEAFCRYLVCGYPDEEYDTLGRPTEAYQAVYECKRGSAQSGAHRLMKREEVRTRIREIRDDLAEQAKARALDWWERVPKAQQTLLDAMDGRYAGDDDSGRARIQAAIQWLDRALGTPRDMHGRQLEGAPIQVFVAGPAHGSDQVEVEGDGNGRRSIEARSRELPAGDGPEEPAEGVEGEESAEEAPGPPNPFAGVFGSPSD